MDNGLNWDKETEESNEFFDLCLYVAGRTPKSIMAFSNLKKICKTHLKDKCHVKVIDILKNPEFAKKANILAVPTLIRKLPEHNKKIIGTFDNEEKVLIGLDLNHF